jgi:hypothetical protein
MIARLTWIPDNGESETLTVDIAAPWLEEFRSLIGTPEWASSEAVMWIPCRTRDDQPMTKRLFRLARIIALEPVPAAERSTP